MNSQRPGSERLQSSIRLFQIESISDGPWSRPETQRTCPCREGREVRRVEFVGWHGLEDGNRALEMNQFLFRNIFTKGNCLTQQTKIIL